MVEVKLGVKTLGLPYMVRVSGVTEEMFEEWVDAVSTGDFGRGEGITGKGYAGPVLREDPTGRTGDTP